MTTLEDIAQEAKVSPSAVSLVINGRPGVGKQTQTRIEAAIRKLNYRRRGAGRPTKGPKAMNIAIVYSQQLVLRGSLAPLTSQWIAAMRGEAVECGSHFGVFAGTGHFDGDPIFRQALEQRDLAGVILIGMADEYGYVSAVRKYNLPLVVMNRRPAYDEFSYVAIDNYGGGRAAAEHLLGLGHGRIGLVQLDPSHSIMAAKIRGFEDALVGQSVKCVFSEPVDLSNIEESAREICRKLLAARVSAVFAMGDDIAAHCLDTLAAMGISVPQQLSVIGFDDLGFTSSAGLRPTTIGYDKEMMGREAVRILLRLTQEKPETQSLSLVAGTRVLEYDTTASRQE